MFFLVKLVLELTIFWFIESLLLNWLMLRWDYSMREAARGGLCVFCVVFWSTLCAWEVHLEGWQCDVWMSGGFNCLNHSPFIYMLSNASTLRLIDWINYDMQTSDVIAESKNELIETKECMKSCGVETMTFGMSTDSLAERGFTKKLCSPRCYDNCPNIIDLYFSLAAEEGTNYCSSLSQTLFNIILILLFMNHTPYIAAGVKLYTHWIYYTIYNWWNWTYEYVHVTFIHLDSELGIYLFNYDLWRCILAPPVRG